MKKQNIHTLSILVANKPGVLVRVALVFARRGYNIDSLVVSPVYNPKFSRMTITAKGDATILEQIIKQVNKLVDVIHACDHDVDAAVDQELSLLKVKTYAKTKTIILKQAKTFKAKLMNETDGFLIFAQTGSTKELDDFETFLHQYGLLEVVRTGKLLMMKGQMAT